MVVPRKPTPLGRESHTTADGDTGCIVFVEPYEGKARMEQKEFVQPWGKNPTKAMRCVKNSFSSARCVILDSGFASLKCATGMAEHGMYMIGNVKSGHAGFPKKWLLDHVPERGNRVACSTVIETSSGGEWNVLAAADRDKQPMTLIGTAGTSNMGETLTRHFTTIRAYGTYNVRSATLSGTFMLHIECISMQSINTTASARARCRLRTPGRPTVGGCVSSRC